MSIVYQRHAGRYGSIVGLRLEVAVGHRDDLSAGPDDRTDDPTDGIRHVQARGASDRDEVPRPSRNREIRRPGTILDVDRRRRQRRVRGIRDPTTDVGRAHFSLLLLRCRRWCDGQQKRKEHQESARRPDKLAISHKSCLLHVFLCRFATTRTPRRGEGRKLWGRSADLRPVAGPGSTQVGRACSV